MVGGLMGKKLYPATQLRELYDAFGYLKKDEQVELAEPTCGKTQRLANRLAHTLKTGPRFVSAA